MDDRSDTVIKLEQVNDHQSDGQTDKSANRAVNHADTIKLEQADNLQPIGQADNIKERANDRQSVGQMDADIQMGDRSDVQANDHQAVGRTDKSVNRTVNHTDTIKLEQPDNLQPIGQTDKSTTGQPNNQTDDASSPTRWDIAM